MNATEIRDLAQDALASRFVAEAETDGATVWLVVRHEDQPEDHCAGQGQVVGQMTRALAALGVDSRRDYRHGGGFTCCTLTFAEIEAAALVTAGAEGA